MGTQFYERMRAHTNRPPHTCGLPLSSLVGLELSGVLFFSIQQITKYLFLLNKCMCFFFLSLICYVVYMFVLHRVNIQYLVRSILSPNQRINFIPWSKPNKIKSAVFCGFGLIDYTIFSHSAVEFLFNQRNLLSWKSTQKVLYFSFSASSSFICF